MVMRNMLPGAALATLLTAAVPSARIQNPAPYPAPPEGATAVRRSPIQLAASPSAVEVSGSDVSRARRATGATVSVTELLDAQGRVLAKLVQSGTRRSTTVRGADAAALEVQQATGADARGAGFDAQDYALIGRAEDGAVTAIELGEASLEIAPSEANAALAGPVGAGQGAATEFALLPNRPNPFRGTTAIHYLLPKEGRVEISLFDVAGRRVARIFDGARVAGPASLDYRPRGLPAGRYEMRLTFAPSDGSAPRHAVRPILLLP
jgi:hypothetical protein